jgi:hypothetical protein
MGGELGGGMGGLGGAFMGGMGEGLGLGMPNFGAMPAVGGPIVIPIGPVAEAGQERCFQTGAYGATRSGSGLSCRAAFAFARPTASPLPATT